MYPPYPLREDYQTVEPLAVTTALPVPDWAIPGGAVGLLMLVALMIYRGMLVPRRFYLDVQRERDYWREAAMKAIGHTDQLLPAAQITTEMVTALAGHAIPKTPPQPDATSEATWRALGGGAGQ